MLRQKTRAGGKHRLGAPGLVHCLRYEEVAQAVTTRRWTWLTAALNPARYGLARLRGRAPRAAAKRAWAPAAA